jgi:hypothetical protein
MKRERDFAYLVVRQTGRREDGDLLTTGDRVHHVDGRDTGLNHLTRILALERVDGLAYTSREKNL